MAKIDLNPLNSIDGFQAAALVDVDSGLALATTGGGVNLEVAAAGNTEVYKAKLKVANTLGLNDKIEDILISLGKGYHLMGILKFSSAIPGSLHRQFFSQRSCSSGF